MNYLLSSNETKASIRRVLSEGFNQKGSITSLALQIGFPIMIKATAGGGGRGMRLAMEEGEFMRLLQQAQQEADAAFGNPDMYLERYVKNPRHIEFQVFCFCSTCLQ